MGKALNKRAFPLTALCLCGIGAGQLTLAQDTESPDTGGTRLTFGIEQRLETSRNLALATPPEGTTTLASTGLSFGLFSETRTQRLALEASGALRLAREPDGSQTATFDAPSVTFSYALEGANSALSFGAGYQRDRIEYLRPASDFTNDDGVIELPTDLADLTGTGERTETTANATLAFGTSGPLGLSLTAGLNQTDYIAATNADLVPSQTVTLGAVAQLQFSGVSTGRIALDQTDYDAEDATNTHRVTSALEFGLTQQFSARGTLDVTLGYSRIKETELGVTSTQSGPTGRLALGYEMPNGTADTALAATTDENGTRLTLDFGRALELPGGTLSARLGVTRAEGGEPEVTGSLAWQRALPTGNLDLQLSRDVASSGTNVETATTLVSVGYTHEINALSGLGLDLSYAVIDETAANQVTRTDLDARYTRALTADWDMNFGVTYSLRTEASLPDAASHLAYISISRQFDLRP